ncbi:MAG: hypothetical protein NVSMB34_10050 [Variovorax sp.]
MSGGRTNDNPRPPLRCPRMAEPASLAGSSIRDRVRPPAAVELEGIPWLNALPPGERRRTEATIAVGKAQPGDLICRVGRSPTCWFGVIESLLEMSNDNADGTSMTHRELRPLFAIKSIAFDPPASVLRKQKSPLFSGLFQRQCH